MKPATKLCFIGLLAVCISLSPAAKSQAPSGRDVLTPTAYLSLDPAAPGSAMEIAVVLKIRPGFHINAREKSADYLIAPDLKADPPAGFKTGEVSYPKGTLENFSFSKTPLNVYQGTVTLRMPITALASAPLGEQHLPLKLRYQACSTEICLPPVTVDVNATINIAAASKPAHREIFNAK